MEWRNKERKKEVIIMIVPDHLLLECEPGFWDFLSHVLLLQGFLDEGLLQLINALNIQHTIQNQPI